MTEERAEMERYRTIVADPPWHYPRGHPARDHKKHPYSTMTLGELCALPVCDWADQSAHLFLWTTNEHLRYAFSVIGAWGFTFKNVIVWCKPGLGMGGTFRNSTEIVLLGERGKCELKRRDVGTWHVWPKAQENSRKPDAFLDLVESVSHGPYLEMFARRNRLGWSTWGNEALPHIDYTSVGVAADALVSRVAEAEKVLAELVDMKDGRHDENYDHRKPQAWREARRIVAASRRES